MKKFTKQEHGFTLAEMLIYATLLTILSIIFISIGISLAKIFRDIKTQRSVRSSAETMLERIGREIRLADTVDTATGTLAVHPGKLVLNTIDPYTETPQTVIFLLDGTRVVMKILGSKGVYLTSSDVAVSNLVFYHIPAGGASEAVRTEATVGGENFYATTILRRSY